MYQIGSEGSVIYVDDTTGERVVLLVVSNGCATFTSDDAPSEIEHLRRIHPSVDAVWQIAIDRLNCYSSE